MTDPEYRALIRRADEVDGQIIAATAKGDIVTARRLSLLRDGLRRDLAAEEHSRAVATLLVVMLMAGLGLGVTTLGGAIMLILGCLGAL